MAVKEQHAAPSIVNQDAVDPSAGYDTDFFQWTQATAEMIRQGRLAEVDLEHVAEEIEDMGKRDRREVRSRLIVLVMHLLKWEFQPERRTPSWRSTIDEQRMQIELILLDSPSLRRLPSDELDATYKRAINRAVTQTGLNKNRFPPSCSYTVEQILDVAFVPEPHSN
jgi:hypothetical protein